MAAGQKANHMSGIGLSHQHHSLTVTFYAVTLSTDTLVSEDIDDLSDCHVCVKEVPIDASAIHCLLSTLVEVIARELSMPNLDFTDDA